MRGADEPSRQNLSIRMRLGVAGTARWLERINATRLMPNRKSPGSAGETIEV
jgi:hypothetical protein